MRNVAGPQVLELRRVGGMKPVFREGDQVARGEPAITYKSPPNVLKDTHDYSCCVARPYEYSHPMTDPPPGAL